MINRMFKKKGQMGSEMIFAAGIILLIFILLIPINISKRNELRQSELFLEKNEDCKTFTNVLAKAASTENLQASAILKNNLTMQANSNIIDVGGVICTSFISLSENVELTKGKYQIKNSNWQISIKNV